LSKADLEVLEKLAMEDGERRDGGKKGGNESESTESEL
jgi:hypothetical protein